MLYTYCRKESYYTLKLIIMFSPFKLTFHTLTLNLDGKKGILNLDAMRLQGLLTCWGLGGQNETPQGLATSIEFDKSKMITAPV